MANWIYKLSNAPIMSMNVSMFYVAFIEIDGILRRLVVFSIVKNISIIWNISIFIRN